MDYSVGNIGRVFTVRLDHGDDILRELEGLAVAEDLHSAAFIMLGAVKEANLVVGPKTNEVPPDPSWEKIIDAHEVLGIGNIFREEGKPKIHLHSVAGRGLSVKAGCLRKESEVFMVAEIFIMEICSISASRIFDHKRGFSPLAFR
ncbi:MAG: DUF296 domain-containing protein [Methanolobus sp.]|nr:DUF296 domain-containing protein [Methanolobus sp.]